MTSKQIVKTIQELPKEGLEELEKYLEYLRYKYEQKPKQGRSSKSARLKDLKGILSGYDFSPEKIAQARQE